MPRVLLIDNVDSFTYNIADLLHRVLGQPPTVWRHDHPANDLSSFDAIVVGPGPGRPQRADDMGISDLALRQREVPVLGVCLGHQGMAHLAGGMVIELATPVHGQVSAVEHDGTGLFEGIPSPFDVVRYHSLEVSLGRSSSLRVTARATDDGVVMALDDPGAPRWGVQFHPESVLSEHGALLVANFLRMAGVQFGGAAKAGVGEAGVGEAGAVEAGAVESGSVAVGDVPRPLPTSTVGARRVRVKSVELGPAPDTWALHQALYAESPTAFWLDASGTSSYSGFRLFEPVAVGPKMHNRLQDEAGEVGDVVGGAAGLRRDSASGRCSVMGDASGPLSYVLTHRVGAGDNPADSTGSSDRAGSVTELSTGERLTGPLLPNLARLRNRLEVTGAVEHSADVTERGVDADGLPGTFRPGFVGYLGYELKAELGGSAAHVSPHPDARLVLADRALVVDHESGVVHAVYLWDHEIRAEQEAWVEHCQKVVRQASVLSADSDRARAWILHGRPGASGEGSMHVDAGGGLGAGGGLDASGGLQGDAQGDVVGEASWRHTESQYLDLISQCQKQIRAGESYEICLTNAATWPLRVDETALAAGMRQASPVPFAAWLRGPGPTVLSASPERFVSVSADGAVEARPIKGTRPRGVDPQADATLVEELRTSVKDRAENLMIVDLLRNDLHRVCRSGSVHVPGIFEVETYATVHQLVSTVRGQLADGMDSLDVIGACFPGGSMTGAPKVRTMRILDRLEGGPRGVYAGALGWIGLDGAMDLSIVIRTVTLTDGVAEFGVGGAITALSDPGEEYAETQVKAVALTRALAAAAE